MPITIITKPKTEFFAYYRKHDIRPQHISRFINVTVSNSQYGNIRGIDVMYIVHEIQYSGSVPFSNSFSLKLN